jgi:predicted RNase H-like HicB family nuclease
MKRDHQYWRYAVILQPIGPFGEGGWRGYVPDLPGCEATGRTREDVLDRLRERVRQHLDGPDPLGPSSEVATVGPSDADVALDAYERDIYLWARAQAARLRARDWDAVDVPNVVDEIESLAQEPEHQIETHLSRLFEDLLLLTSDGRRRRYRRVRICEHRDELGRYLKGSPSLRLALPDFVAEAYEHAVARAAIWTGRPRTGFPSACPWTVGQVLDDDWFPDPPRSGAVT